MEEEKCRRFKCFVCEYKGKEETYYFNNGSIDGLKIVTFVTKDTPFDPVNFSMGQTISYY